MVGITGREGVIVSPLHSQNLRVPICRWRLLKRNAGQRLSRGRAVSPNVLQYILIRDYRNRVKYRDSYHLVRLPSNDKKEKSALE